MLPPFIAAGASQLPAIVFLHGGPLSSRMFAPNLPLLSNSAHCLAPDLAGHGANKSPFSITESASQVARLIEEKAVGGKAAVVGVSLGGAVALQLLRAFPERVSRVMISGTSGKLGRTLGMLTVASSGLVGPLSREWQAKRTLDELRVPEAMRAFVYDDMVSGTTPQYLKTVARELMALEEPQSIDVPMLIAVGSEETWAARKSAQRLLRTYPSARGVQIQGLRHLWNLEDPALFAEAVEAWTLGRPFPDRCEVIQ